MNLAKAAMAALLLLVNPPPIFSKVDPLALKGIHFNITTIHELGYTDMGYDGNSIKAPEEWSGMIPAMIAWISRKAGFTYTLSSPSGSG